MANQNIQRNKVRIPNLPMGPLVNDKGYPTDEELTFRQALLTLLQEIAGDEGLVMPSQPSTNVTTIQNNTQQTPGTSPATSVYTCAFGTMIYDVNDDIPAPHPLKDEVVVAVNDGTGKPIFKQVLLADNATLYPTAGAITGYALTTYLGIQYKIALYALS